MKITYMSNAGLLLTSGDKRVIVDGLHGGVGPFARLPSSVTDQIFTPGSSWQDADCLVFTHTHPDHFDRELTARYMTVSSKSTLLLPRSDDVTGSTEWGGRANFMDAGMWQSGSCQCGEVHIRYYRTKHDGAQYSHVTHYSLLITLKEETALILGDADFRRSELHSLLRDLRPDVAIVNFLTANSAEGRHLIKNEVKARCVVVCHLPLLADDRFGYTKVARRDAEKYRDQLPPVHIFSTPLESIETGYSM